ncbi:MAG: hypothetical protein KAX46_04455 [Chromatiaceae bacterium]|nr:hypothetical protein [Chromatiaceae bacterium]
MSRYWALLGLIAFNAVLVFMVVHLTFFAAEGARYTAEDGRQDRADSLSRDTNLAVRIGELEHQLAAHTHD